MTSHHLGLVARPVVDSRLAESVRRWLVASLVATDAQIPAHHLGETKGTTLEISTTGVVPQLRLQLHQHSVRRLREGPADSLMKSSTSVAETPLLLLVVLLLPCMQAELQFNLPSTKDQAVRLQETPMKAGNLTVHRAHLEPGIPRRLL